MRRNLIRFCNKRALASDVANRSRNSRIEFSEACQVQMHQIQLRAVCVSSGNRAVVLLLYRSISSFEFLIFALEDAPNNMDSIPSIPQTYSSASRGGMVPAANTCMAINLHLFSAIVFSYTSFPPDILNPILLIDAQMVGFSMPQLSSVLSNSGRFMVIYAGSAWYFSRIYL